MGFFYPTAVSTGYSSIASYMAGRFNTVTGSSGLDASNLISTGTDGFLQSMADSIAGVLGFQAHDDAAGIAAATNGTSTFADVGDGSTTGFSTFTFTAPTSKLYVVNVDLSCYMTIAADTVYFRLLKDGNSVFDSPAARLSFNTLSEHHRISFRCPVAMLAGANILKLQWKVAGAAGTAKVDTGDFRCFTIMG